MIPLLDLNSLKDHKIDKKCCSLAVKRKIENRDLNDCQVGLEQQGNLVFRQGYN